MSSRDQTRARLAERPLFGSLTRFALGLSLLLLAIGRSDKSNGGTQTVAGICPGSYFHPTAAEYENLVPISGDGHGQAPVLWAAMEILR